MDAGKTVKHQMPPHVFLNEHHWKAILDALFKEVLQQGQPPHGPLGQAWKLLSQANQYKRFTIEVENPNHDALGAIEHDKDLEIAKRAGWPKPDGNGR